MGEVSSALDVVAMIRTVREQDVPTFATIMADYPGIWNDEEARRFVGALVGMVIGFAERLAEVEDISVDKILQNYAQTYIMDNE